MKSKSFICMFAITTSAIFFVKVAYSQQNVGIGTNSPTHSRLEINGSVGAAVAMFGADGYGVTIQANNPEIGFNYFYNGGAKAIKTGYAGVMGMNPANGDIYIGNFNGSQSPADFATITGYQVPFTLKQSGRVGIGVINPNSALLQVELANNSTITTAILGKYNYTNNFGIGRGVEGDGFGFGAGIYGVNAGAGYAGYFSGNLAYTGTLTNASDQKLKENIKPATGMLDKILQLKPSSYNYKKEYSKMNLPQKQQLGFLAQDMEKVFPQLVNENYDKDVDNGTIFQYKGINYMGLIPVLTKAIQELAVQNADLKNNNTQLEKQLSELSLTISSIQKQLAALTAKQNKTSIR
ncbi:MAG: chaperone of endosialidase [Ferruginibacter sp.]|nr:chaperone of endosialidase [Ferruginibacter sp.]